MNGDSTPKGEIKTFDVNGSGSKFVKKEYFSEVLNSPRDRLKNYSNLFDIINSSLSDIKDILSEEREKTEEMKKGKSEPFFDTLLTFEEEITTNENAKNKRAHKTIKSCDYDELEKIKKELGITEGRKVPSRNKFKKMIMEKLYMTTIDENEEKNNESYEDYEDWSDCSSIQENVVILQPKGGELFSKVNVFSKKFEKLEKYRSRRKEENLKRNVTNKTNEKTTVENEFLVKTITKKSNNNNIILDKNQGYIVKKK